MQTLSAQAHRLRLQGPIANPVTLLLQHVAIQEIFTTQPVLDGPSLDSLMKSVEQPMSMRIKDVLAAPTLAIPLDWIPAEGSVPRQSNLFPIPFSMPRIGSDLLPNLEAANLPGICFGIHSRGHMQQVKLLHIT